MKRDLSIEEARDEKIAELTEKHLEARRALLSNGDENLTSTVCEALWVELTDQLWQGMVQICVTEPATAGVALAMIVGKVLRADAEVEALRDVEQMEKGRAKAADEERAEQVLLDRVH
jgi:hypothetical protein